MDTIIHNNRLVMNAKKVQNILARNIVESVIAGGLPRDMAHGVKAKDADVCVYNYHSMDDAENTLVRIAFQEVKDICPEAQWIDGCQSDGSVASFQDHQVAMLWRIPSLDVDVIFYEDCHPSPSGMFKWFREGKRITNHKQLVSMFDSNMNQYILSSISEPVFLGDMPPAEGVMMVRNDCHKRPERIAKARLFAETHGYEFIDDLFNPFI